MIAQLSKSAFKALALLPVCALATLSASAAPTTFYPQPEPSNAEQHMLELINRARSNPAAEGQMLANISDSNVLYYYTYFGVDRSRLISDFASYPARPPLAFNADLMDSARTQSVDQATNGFESHDGSNGSQYYDRISSAGYDWQAAGENVSAYAVNASFAHASFNADWGVPNLDHRENIMNTNSSFPVFKEVGISCVATSVTSYGPMVVTQDFGTPRDVNKAFLVGVIYNDLNGNGVYDEGEGLGGVTVTPDNGTYYTTTSASGGFTLPLPEDASGTLTVTASGGSLGAPRVKTISYTVGTNTKLDFTTADAAGAPLTQVAIKTVIKNAAADGSRVGMVKVSRLGDASKDLTVALKVGGNAVSGVDYSALPATVTIPAGQSEVSITVAPVAKEFSGVKKVKLAVAPGSDYMLSSGATAAKVKILQ